MSALNAALCRCGIILWLAVLLASRSTHSAPVYDQDTTQVAEYDGAAAGCYFNYQRYQEGDRIITSEPCLNCTCHNRMLMCYLKVCPFTKAIGQDCTVEKRPDQCCPVITCPEVPVQLLTSTTSAPAISDSTELGFHDNYGCVVGDRFYADGAQLSVDHHNPCELCYCIRNRTTCVMQECTLRVAGCKPVYQPGICCPIKYNCEYDEESSTTVGPTPGLIMTTTLPPGILPQCYHEGKVYEDGDLIYSTQPCQHCYCFRGEIACAVQNCGTPMQEHGKNCTALPPPEGECCPTTYECEEGVEGEEQLPEQVPHDLPITESPMLIDEEQQEKGEHPQEESFPGADNTIPRDHEVEEEEEGVQGIIEHITTGYVSSTEKPEEGPATLPESGTAVPEIETTVAEKEFTPSHEHVTEASPVVVASEEAVTAELPTKTEISTIAQETSEASEEPGVELPGASSTSAGLQPEEETITTERMPEEHISTEESIVEKEHSTLATGEKEQPSVSDETQTESVTKSKPEEGTSPHEELPAQVSEEVTEAEKVTEEGQVSVTETPKRPEISTEIVEKATSPITEGEQLGVTTIPESVTELTKDEDEDKIHQIETTSVETLATETESPVEEATVIIAHDISSTEETATEKKEISHSTETTVTEEAQPTEVSGLPKGQPEEEQKPAAGEGEKVQGPEESTSEHTVIEEEHVTVGAKKEDAGLTESPAMSEKPVTTEEQHTEKSTPEIPPQGPTGIPIPERMPEQKAEDQYHVTEDYHDITRPEVVSPDNLVTELPQKTTVAPSEETAQPISEEATEVHLPTEKEPSVTEIATSTEEAKTESIPVVVPSSTESSITTVVYEEPAHLPEQETEKPSVPEETKTEVPQTDVQSTEQVPSGEELPAKGLTVDEGFPEKVGGSLGEKESQPKKEESSEEEAGTQPPIVTEPEVVPETPVPIPIEREHSTVPSDLGQEQVTEGEQIITVIPSEGQSTQFPQAEEKETETIPVEEEKPIIGEKPAEEHGTEEPAATPGVIGEEEKELQTEEPISKEQQTTETLKEIEEKPTSQAPVVEEEKTVQPEQYSTEKVPEEVAVTEGHDLQETEAPITEEKPKEIAEGTKGVPTEGVEQQTEIIITEKTPSEEIEVEPTQAYPTEKVEEESEEKIFVPVSTEKTVVPEIESTETPTVEKKPEEQTATSVSGEHLPTQPSITDRKEDQEPSEPSEEEQGGEEQITQKPSLGEKETTETYEEPQKPIVLSETEGTHIPLLEETTESVPLEQKPIESAVTTESVGTGEIVTQPAIEKQHEITSEQPQEGSTESEQEKQSQAPVTEEQPELHVRKETETPSSVTHEEPYVTPTSAVPEESTVKKEDVGISESIEVITSESTTKSVLISGASTEIPIVEEHTEQEVSVEKEITESVPSEEGQQETHEPTTQSSITEKIPSQEISTGVPVEISTEEVATPETPKVPVIEEQKPEGEEIITETPVIKEHSTFAPEETPVIKVATEVPLKEIPQYSTEYPTSAPEEIPEKESTSEIAPRPSGIPGEGNCLVEGQSYNNNSAVPPANACQTSCRCVSSIVQCELVQCPAPPAYLSNCMPVQPSGDSCCPTYACDSTSTAELESDSHKIESQTPEAEEEGQKTVPTSEIPTEESVGEITEAPKESSTIISEISTPESRPVEVTVPSVSQPEEVGSTVIEKQQTTIKSVESGYEQPTTIGQSVEQYPEEHTISFIPETSEQPVSQVPEKEEHTEPQSEVETTEGKISEEGEGVTKLEISTEQPQEETVEEQTPVSGEEQVITSTSAPAEQKPHDIGEEESTSPRKEEEVTVPNVTEGKDISVSVEVSTSPEKEEEVTTVAAGKEEEITTFIKEQEKPTEEEGAKEQSTLKPTEGAGEQPEEKPQPTPEEPISSTVEGHETSMKPEEVTEEQPVKPEEEEKTIKPVEYESTPLHEIQPTTERKPEEVTSTESEQVVQTEEPEIQTQLPAIVPSEEAQKPITPAAESTTLIHDHTITEAPLEEHETIKSVEISTEESKAETKPEISTEATETAKTSTEGAVLEVSHEETSPESVVPTESTMGIEITEHVEEQTDRSVTEHEGEPSVTKLPEEKPSEHVSPEISTEQPTKETAETEAEHEKPTEPSIHKPESTQAPVEEHSEVTPETESHTTKLPTEEHTVAEEIPTTSVPTQEEAGEQPVTSIVKDISEPSLGEAETEQPVITETKSEAPAVQEQTPKSEQQPVEEQTVSSLIPSESETPQSGVSTEEATPESVTSQEEHVTEKTTESAKPETESPELTEEHVTVSEIEKEVGEGEQKPGITEEAGKEEPSTEEAVKEEAVTHATTTEGHPAVEAHTEPEAITPSEIELGVKVQAPVESEATILPKEPEEEGQVTSEASLPEHPVSEEATTVAGSIAEEHSTALVETEKEKEVTREPEYQTTISILEEEVSKPTIEASTIESVTAESATARPEEHVTISEVSSTEQPEKISPETEKLPSEGESVTAESATARPEEHVTISEVSSTEQPEKISPETEKPVKPEQETISPEEQQGETTTVEGIVTEGKLPEETISQIPEKSTEVPSTTGEEEAHFTVPTLPIETTSVHEEEQPSITKLQPTEGPLPSEEEISITEETHPSQPEEGGEIHPSQPEEGGEIHPSQPEEGGEIHPSVPEEHTSETPIAGEPEEHPEIEQTSEAVPAEEYPIKVSGASTALPEEKITAGPVSSEEPEHEVPISPEEHVTKTQPAHTELPTPETTEEIAEEGEEVVHPHIDHFPEATLRPETDYSAEGELTLGSDEEHLRPVNHTMETTERPYQPDFHERPSTTSASHIPEYPDQSVSGEDNPHFPMQGGSYLNPDEDYDEDDQAIYGPGTCRYGGKVYVSAQQIPRDDPCDFCFCFRSDIICLQQSCPPPIPGCHEEPISGFCCPRYECPVSMATALNLTTTTTTTTTTLPPHFHAHAYKGAARRSGCQIRGQTYRVGEVIKSASGPCLHCTCGGDGNMKCDPRVCSPEPMLRQMIAAATAKRRR